MTRPVDNRRKPWITFLANLFLVLAARTLFRPDTLEARSPQNTDGTGSD